MGITQKDIAKEMGVSLLTVNRAFNNSGHVSQELRKRILDYAKKSSYVPHRASQIMVRNKTKVLAVFSPTFPINFWKDIKRGVESAAAYIKPLNYEVYFHSIPDYDTASFLKVLRKEIKNGLDAVAFPYQRIYEMKKILRFVKDAEIPYIFYNKDNPAEGRLCYIGADYRSGGRLAATFIGKALSFKRQSKVLLVGLSGEQYIQSDGLDANQLRISGFIDLMKKNYPQVGCQIEYLTKKNNSDLDEEVLKLMKRNKGSLDALYFVSSHNDAFLNGLEYYNYSNSITMLHDITDLTLRQLEKGFLTASVYQNPILQGYTLVRTLEEILELKTRERQRDIEVAHELIFRENINVLKYPYFIMDR
jgi:LacI family transcriptional regulator